jgi:hypothetical protein
MRTGHHQGSLWGGHGGARRGVLARAGLSRVRTTRALAGPDLPGVAGGGRWRREGQVVVGSGGRATGDDAAGDGRGPRRRRNRRAASRDRAGGLWRRLAGRGTTQRGETRGHVLQGAETGVDRPESLSLGIHDACEAGSEQLRVAQADLVIQALGVGQEDGGGTLRDGGLGTRGRVREAIQKLTVREQSGSMFSLGESCLREGWKRNRPSGRAGRLCGGRGVGRSGDRERSRAHRPRSSDSPVRASKRISEVTDRSSRFQDKAGCRLVGSLVTPPDAVIPGLAGFLLGTTPHVDLAGGGGDRRSDSAGRELVRLSN